MVPFSADRKNGFESQPQLQLISFHAIDCISNCNFMFEWYVIGNVTTANCQSGMHSIFNLFFFFFGFGRQMCWSSSKAMNKFGVNTELESVVLFAY